MIFILFLCCSNYVVSFVATAPAPTGASEGKFTLIVLILFAVFLGLILFCSYYFVLSLMIFILSLFCSNFVVSFVATAATPHQNTTIGVCEFTTETYSYQYVDDNVLLIKEFQQPVVQKCPISRESFFIRPCYIELLKVY